METQTQIVPRMSRSLVFTCYIIIQSHSVVALTTQFVCYAIHVIIYLQAWSFGQIIHILKKTVFHFLLRDIFVNLKKQKNILNSFSRSIKV